MTVLDYILEGLEAELALERELGVRFVDYDREVLKVEAAAESVSEAPPQEPPRNTASPSLGLPSTASSPTPTPTPQPTPTPSTSAHYDFVFLHHKELSEGGKEMMVKIIGAMGKTIESAPIVTETPIPKAKVYVILGGLALRKFQPKLKGVPGEWLTSERGAEILVTYSPEYILRFKEVTPAIRKIKGDMWLSLKSVLQRI